MIGQEIGGYLISRKIGGGGMGAVYYGEHKSLGRPAAIKVLHPQFSSNPEVLERFFNEARSTGLIRHPGLVDIFDFGTLPSGEAYLAMEFLQGEPLSARIKRDTKLALDATLHITRQMASALNAAHAKGIIHRDLKPDNIFLVYDEDLAHGMRAKVLDFGVAKLTDSGVNAYQTNISAVLGTPRYMSPEQCRGAANVEPRSDIYSLGCMMYEMVCGRSPFTGDVGDLLLGHMREEPAPPKERAPEVPDFLNNLILWTLKKEISDRPANMQAVISAVDAHRPVGEHSTAVKLPTVQIPAQNPDPHAHSTIVWDPGNSTALVNPITTMSGAASEKTPAPTQFMPNGPLLPNAVTPTPQPRGADSTAPGVPGQSARPMGLYAGGAVGVLLIVVLAIVAFGRRHPSELPQTAPVATTTTAKPDPTPTAKPDPTPTPTAKPDPTPTAKPDPTPTAKPDPTPTAKPDPTPTPTVTSDDPAEKARLEKEAAKKARDDAAREKRHKLREERKSKPAAPWML